MKFVELISKNWINILAAIVIGLIIYLFYQRCNEIKFIQDDAFISLRYVENFVNGNGLVFNHGENVEGYTNFLWVMILSASLFFARAFNIHLNLSQFSQNLSILFGSALFFLVFLFTKKLINKITGMSSPAEIIISSFSLFTPFMLLYSAPIVYWSVGGMETTLFLFLTLLTIHRFLFFQENSKVDFIFIASSVANALIRPEGLLIFFLLEIFAFIIQLRTSGFKSALLNRKMKLEILYFLIPISFHLTFRLIYYGYFFPNTFYAKTGFNFESLRRGFDYLVESIKNNFEYGLFLLPPLFLISNKNVKPHIQFFCFFIISYSSYIIVIGGDVLPIDRFALPIILIVFSYMAASLFFIQEKMHSVVLKIIFIAISIVLITYYSINNNEQYFNQSYIKRSYEAGLVKKMQIYGEWVREQSKTMIKSKIKGKIKGKSIIINKRKDVNEISVALSTIGSFSFYSGAKVIDIVGLTDEFIAHNPKEVPGIDEELPVLWKERRYNAEYVFSKKPDYIIFPAGAKPTAFAECAIFVQPEFVKNYYCQLIYSQELKQLLPIFTRREIPLEINYSDCNVKFVKPFIEANNFFLNMISTNNKAIINLIMAKVDEAEKLCNYRFSELYAVRGYSQFHIGNNAEAKKYFEKSVLSDSLNMISRYYLMKIYNEEGKSDKLIQQIKMLKKYSPDSLPYLIE
jgi:tetratricopeptide (TPR) repeat protein